MLGFIVTGLKLVGKIIVKAVKAAVVGAVVGCAVEHRGDFDEAAESAFKVGIHKMDEINDEIKAIPNGPNLKNFVHGGGLVLKAFVIAIMAIFYGITMAMIWVVTTVIDTFIEVISKIIFKSNKEEENLCSE